MITFLSICLLSGCESSTAFADQRIGTLITSKSTMRVLGKTEHETHQIFISNDGTRIARYTNGGQKIEINHLTKHTGVQYIYDATDGNGWQKLETLGIDSGIQAFTMFDQKVQQDRGTPTFIGTARVAGLTCKKYTFTGGLSWCTWQREHIKMDKRMPVNINLTSRWDLPKGDFTEDVVQSVQFDIAIDERKFSPPAEVMKRPVFDPTKDENNPTNAWCKAERAKNGIDPCAEDQDDEEAWDVD
jgi:hypothetical protein